MLFLRYRFKFYVFFQKCSKIFVTLIYELEQKSSLRTQEIAFPRS